MVALLKGFLGEFRICGVRFLGVVNKIFMVVFADVQGFSKVLCDVFAYDSLDLGGQGPRIG